MGTAVFVGVTVVRAIRTLALSFTSEIFARGCRPAVLFVAHVRSMWGVSLPSAGGYGGQRLRAMSTQVSVSIYRFFICPHCREFFLAPSDAAPPPPPPFL